MAFPFAKYPLSPHPHIQVWDIKEQLPAQTLKFCSTLGKGRREKDQKRQRVAAFPTLLTMTLALPGWARYLY